MSYETDPKAPILVAIPDEWRDKFWRHFSELGYQLLFATTRVEALHIIQSVPLIGLSATADLMLSNENEKAHGLINFARGAGICS